MNTEGSDKHVSDKERNLAMSCLSDKCLFFLLSFFGSEHLHVLFKFFLIGIVEGGVHFGPLSTAATNRPIVPAPGEYVHDDG
jgi:hypothetical protein